MSAKLTGMQEKYCQGVASGLSQADAYRAAYPNFKGAAKTLHEKASRLSGEGKIKARIEELKARVEEKFVLTQAEALNYLARLVTTPPSEIDDTSELCQGRRETKYGSEILIPSKLTALDQLAKQQGWYPKQQVEIEAGPGLLEELRKRNDSA